MKSVFPFSILATACFAIISAAVLSSCGRSVSNPPESHILSLSPSSMTFAAQLVGSARSLFGGSGYRSHFGPYFHPWGSCKHKVVSGRTRGFEEAS